MFNTEALSLQNTKKNLYISASHYNAQQGHIDHFPPAPFFHNLMAMAKGNKSDVKGKFEIETWRLKTLSSPACNVIKSR